MELIVIVVPKAREILPPIDKSFKLMEDILISFNCRLGGNLEVSINLLLGEEFHHLAMKFSNT